MPEQRPINPESLPGGRVILDQSLDIETILDRPVRNAGQKPENRTKKPKVNPPPHKPAENKDSNDSQEKSK